MITVNDFSLCSYLGLGYMDTHTHTDQQHKHRECTEHEFVLMLSATIVVLGGVGGGGWLVHG